jgi:hypothetical protein
VRAPDLPVPCFRRLVPNHAKPKLEVALRYQFTGSITIAGLHLQLGILLKVSRESRPGVICQTRARLRTLARERLRAHLPAAAHSLASALGGELPEIEEDQLAWPVLQMS